MNSANNCFYKALSNYYRTAGVPVIPDIKSRSPKEGDLLRGRNPVEIALALAAAGAPVLSVVTEPVYFGGAPELLGRIVQATALPVLRKDFINNSDQLRESADLGAGAVLLIASMLEKNRLFRLVENALSLGLEPLVETHTQAEINLFNQLKLEMVGVNNRNIVELEMDDGSVDTTESLITAIRPGVFIISESSFSSRADVLRAAGAGAHAVLVGTAILRAEDPAAVYHSLGQGGMNRP